MIRSARTKFRSLAHNARHIVGGRLSTWNRQNWYGPLADRKISQFPDNPAAINGWSNVQPSLRAELERKENGIFSQISASIPPAIVTEARSEELRNYLIAQLNFFHLKTLYRMSTRDLEGKWDDSFYTPEEEYPPGVYKPLMKNAVIDPAAVNKNKDRVSISGVQNVQELRSVLRTSEDAMSVMREYFRTHPPEETELYQKNMERIGNDKNNRKFWEVSFQKLSDKDIKESSRCLGFSPRSFAVVKVPPFYQLFVFQSGKRFKIGSLLCTEPPCVD